MKTKTNILLLALDERLDAFRAQFKTCRRDFSEEAVHDLRVAARRLLAALDLARVFSPKPSLQKTRRELKRFLDELDDLRDTQVQLVDFTDLLETFPQARGIVKDLKKQEKKLLRAAENELKKARLAEISERVEKARARLEAEIPAEGFDAALLSSVDEAFGRAKQAHGQVDAGEAESIHRLRVAFKKFRYSVEAARPLLRKVPKTIFKDMHNYQGKMGDVQDTRVMLEMLAEFAERNPEADLAPVREALEKRRAELVATFMQVKDELSAFWRAQPEEIFPWERPDETVHHSSRNRRGSRGSRNRPAKGTDGQGPEKDEQDRARPEGVGGEPGSDPDQPLPAGNANGRDAA
jgi:CHAD domain-containing protein